MVEERIEELLTELHNLRREYEQAKKDLFGDVREEGLRQAINFRKELLRRHSWELLSLLAHVQAQLSKYDGVGSHDNIPLVDYTCSFQYQDQIDYGDYRLHRHDEKIDHTQIVMSFLTNDKESIYRMMDKVKTHFYFSVNDVLIENYSKPSYITQLKKAEKRLKELCLFDKKGSPTDLNKLIYTYRGRIEVDEVTNFTYNDMLLFLKDLLNGVYREEVMNETKGLVRRHPKIIEQLRSADLD